MAAGLLWLTRIPSTSSPWLARVADPASLIALEPELPGRRPAGDAASSALGISILVAPLTTALMSSVPTRNSGLASAINNAISRIGPLLAGAVHLHRRHRPASTRALHDRVPVARHRIGGGARPPSRRSTHPHPTVPAEQVAAAPRGLDRRLPPRDADRRAAVRRRRRSRMRSASANQPRASTKPIAPAWPV